MPESVNTNRPRSVEQRPQHKTNTVKTSAAFPSKYLKADDLQGKDVVVKIAKVTMEEFDSDRGGNESKLIIAFAGKDKTLVCNKTNAKTIAKVLGSDETDDWIGKCITIGPREVEFQGEQVWAIRVSLKAPAVGGPAKAKPSPVPPPDEYDAQPEAPGDSDSVPF